jgi:uncharacterized damage-inducible protein DinB
MQNHWVMLAGYNAWANARIYAAVLATPGGTFHADGGVFFGTLCGTLNHLLVTDRIWMKRFTGEGDAPDRLDAILHDDVLSLSEARAAEDRRISDWVAGLTQERLNEPVRYARMAVAETIEQPLSSALAHMFNHQTHHRGQAHALLTQFGGRDAGPALDLVTYQREAGLTS